MDKEVSAQQPRCGGRPTLAGHPARRCHLRDSCDTCRAWPRADCDKLPRVTHTPTRARGFTLVELMVVVAIIAILALMAVPSMQGKYVREQIAEGVTLAKIAKDPVAAAWTATKSVPDDNASAGLPAAEKIVSNVVKSVTIEGGAIHIVFGNKANGALKGKTLSLRPAVVEDAQIVPVAWVCGHARPPENMRALGADRTDIPNGYLPVNCL